MLRRVELGQEIPSPIREFILVPTLATDCDLSVTGVRAAMEKYSEVFKCGDPLTLLVSHGRWRTAEAVLESDLISNVQYVSLPTFPLNAFALVGAHGMVWVNGA